MAAKRAPQTSDALDTDSLSFEQALERLETIVSELEAGSLSLEDSLSRYEEGIRMFRRLSQTLDAADKRIERLVEEEGQPSTRHLELDLERSETPTRKDELPF